MKILKVLLLILLFFITNSCIEEYTIPNEVVLEFESELVLEGRILSGEESVIFISKTVPFTGGEVEPDSTAISNAQVTIIGENGYESPKAVFDDENKRYNIDTYNLENNTRYAVKAIVDGETYQSEFQTLLNTPEIDDVTYKERLDGISIHVSSHGDNSHSKFYMWSCEEDWEFHADFDFVRASKGIYLFNEKTYVIKDKGINPYYYCWGHRNSNGIHIYSTESLEENSLKEVELFRIPTSDIRISYIYSVLVKQWSLDSKAYNYYETMEIQTEENNGLFAPMPADVKGNIKCISDPKKKVRGYVIASNVNSKRIFIYASDLEQVYPDYSNCSYQYAWEAAKFNPSWQIAWLEEINKNGAVVFTEYGLMDETSSLKYRKECVDCRQTAGATKKRPDFWPNNHE